jgi:pimeloyl-ACP methyl ester carboxylesterase
MCALEAEEGFAVAPNGVRIFYRISGKGPFALVMPVNWGADSFIYTKGLSSLEYYLALVTFDPRGVGRSDSASSPDEFALPVTARDAACVADGVGLKQSVVIGHSSGGAVALTYALLYPTRVSHLILVSTAARWADGEDQGIDVPYPETEEEMRDQFRASIDSAVVDPSRFGRAMGEILPKMRFSPARFRWTGEVEWSDYDVRPRLRDVRVPTLIVHGREDRIEPLSRAEELHSGIPGSDLVSLDGCGHWPFVERRAEFVAAVTTFLGVEPPQRVGR